MKENLATYQGLLYQFIIVKSSHYNYKTYFNYHIITIPLIMIQTA